MAPTLCFSTLTHTAIMLVSAIFLIITCPSSFASPDQPIDLSSSCPHLSTISSIKHSPPPNTSFLVVVPWKVGFEQFVRVDPHSCVIDGFSVQVFLQAIRRMHPHPLHFKFVVYGDGIETPSYDDMVNMVAQGEVDAVVADLTITSDRMDKVKFTMPYIASMLVMVTPFRYGSAGTLWDFLKPFSMPLWLTLLAGFVATGATLYLLENKNPDFSNTPKKLRICAAAPSPESSSHGASAPDHTAPAPADNSSAPAASAPPPDPSSLQRPGPPIYDQASHTRRFMNAYWFTSLCVFQAQQESVRTHLGRLVTVIWLFTMLIFNSSYTASLASLLSAQKRYPTIEGFKSLQDDNNISVGFQEGSFVKNYMKRMRIDQHRLKNFMSETDYAKALREGNLNPNGVGAVLDELPYIQILLQSECFLTKSPDDDNLPTYGGFGFAFSKTSPLVEEMSKRIVEMEEDETLKKLQDGWGIGGAKGNRCSSMEDPSHLRLRSFGGLFSILGGVYVFCIVWHLSIKVFRSKEEGCCHIAKTLACIQGGCHVCGGEASIRRSLSKVSDVSFEDDSL